MKKLYPFNCMVLAVTGIFILPCNKPDGSNTPTNETNLTDENTNNNENEENDVSNNPIATITMKTAVLSSLSLSRCCSEHRKQLYISCKFGFMTERFSTE